MRFESTLKYDIFKVFQKQKNDAGSLSDDYNVQVFFEDKDFLWLGTINGFNRFNKKTQVFKSRCFWLIIIWFFLFRGRWCLWRFFVFIIGNIKSASFKYQSSPSGNFTLHMFTAFGTYRYRLGCNTLKFLKFKSATSTKLFICWH